MLLNKPSNPGLFIQHNTLQRSFFNYFNIFDIFNFLSPLPPYAYFPILLEPFSRPIPIPIYNLDLLSYPNVHVHKVHHNCSKCCQGPRIECIFRFVLFLLLNFDFDISVSLSSLIISVDEVETIDKVLQVDWEEKTVESAVISIEGEKG